MQPSDSSSAAGGAYLAVKILALIAELGIMAALAYAGITALRYWSGIGV